MRKLVTVRTISELRPIPGADAIECAVIDGWTVVVKKGEFKLGDKCVYFEIDSFLPESDERFAFLMKSGVREFEGVRGHKLRTVKLRGQLSQGLALPVSLFVNDFIGSKFDEGQELSEFFIDGADLTELLGIKKWEMPIPAQLAGQVKGPFPSFIQKTDQERCQNLVTEIFGDLDAEYEVTLKLDGTSFTAYIKDGELGVCSRNLELKLSDENNDNSLVRALIDSGLGAAMKVVGDNFAVQCELMGPGIQGNREKLKEPTLFVFDIYDIDSGKYLPQALRLPLFHQLQVLSQKLGKGIRHAPVLHGMASLRSLGLTNLDELLKFAEGPSLAHEVREGVVFKRLDGGFSFKAISNKFLLGEKE